MTPDILIDHADRKSWLPAHWSSRAVPGECTCTAMPISGTQIPHCDSWEL